MTSRTMATDYLVVGAGAMGMAFTDALLDHCDAEVTLVDRRHGPGGHWSDAYPFVQLHQASSFYGVASTILGTGATQVSGPEAGLHERARRSEVQAYYDHVLHRRFLPSGRVTFLPGFDHRSDGGCHVAESRVSGERVEIHVRRRMVDATYLAPTVPATTDAPFSVTGGARVVPVNDLADVVDAPSEYVIVGSGKTATDAIVWLLGNGVDADRIVWIRPRDPWMLNRAMVQPDPRIAVDLATDTMEAAAEAASLDDLFLMLEDAGDMLRIDPDVTPTMAKAPTLASWELELLRSVERVVHLGHIREVAPGEITLGGGAAKVSSDALVVHCAASGLANPPMVPIWSPDAIRLQTIRAGFPCFCAALAGYVEATRDDDRDRNRLCPPNLYGDSLGEWALMQARGALAAASYSAEPDIAEWADGCALNPARATPEQRADPTLRSAVSRLAEATAHGLPRLAELAGRPPR